MARNIRTETVMKQYARENRLGARLRELREARGLSLRDVASLVGGSYNTIYRLEHNEMGMPEQWMLTALARVLGTTEIDLLTAAGYCEPDPLTGDLDPKILAGLRRLPPTARQHLLRMTEALEPVLV
jgi:transcriptional regulator with XRE-family HTH domain